MNNLRLVKKSWIEEENTPTLLEIALDKACADRNDLAEQVRELQEQLEIAESRIGALSLDPNSVVYFSEQDMIACRRQSWLVMRNYWNHRWLIWSCMITALSNTALAMVLTAAHLWPWTNMLLATAFLGFGCYIIYRHGASNKRDSGS